MFEISVDFLQLSAVELSVVIFHRLLYRIWYAFCAVLLRNCPTCVSRPCYCASKRLSTVWHHSQICDRESGA